MHHVLSSYGEEDLHKYNLPCAFALQRKTFLCTSSGGALATYEDNSLSFTISHTLSPLKTSISLSSITKKGEIVSASSATPSWFWSIDDKVG